MAFRLVPKSETLNDLRRHNVITLKILDCKANCIELVEDDLYSVRENVV